MGGQNKVRNWVVALFRQYRPLTVCDGFPEGDTAFQAQNGYARDTAWWFRFEPVEWTVLDPAEGLLISRRILDAQPFTDQVYRETVATGSGQRYNDLSDPAARTPANSYRSSYLRAWLNGAFYDAAFTGPQREYIDARFVAPEEVSIAVQAPPEATANAGIAATATEATASDADTAKETPDTGDKERDSL